MKKYDIFISYRRDGGYDTAKHLFDLLSRDGYNVSFDIDTLRNGDFDNQLYERIDQCKDFILIVDQRAFERTINNTPKEQDWLRCELAYALKRNKNIIPIFLSGVQGFPQGLPKDIISVTKKNGPEFNKYYFNDFYRVLKTRFLHKKRNKLKKTLSFILLLSILLSAFIFVFYNGHFVLNEFHDDVNYNDTISSHSNITEEHISSEDTLNNTLEEGSLSENETNSDKSREEILNLYSGGFTIVAPGAMKDGITWVYDMELDPINSKCTWIEDDIINIRDSKGYCGTLIKGVEAWEVYNFSLHNSLKYAIMDMRRVDSWYEGENQVCKVKIELDSFNNLKMSFIEGNSAPSPLCDEKGKYNNIATFYRE